MSKNYSIGYKSTFLNFCFNQQFLNNFIKTLLMRHLTSIVLAMLFFASCQYKETQSTEMENGKSLVCTPDKVECEPQEQQELVEMNLPATQKVEILYFTDPICSACWAIEPELKRFKMEYGDIVEITYVMGGLLPGWEGFKDSANGISGPKDVAHHWDEVGQYSGMSIDGDVWLEDPLDSSYPPSKAYKAMELQGFRKAQAFLRLSREWLFLNKVNIAKEENLFKLVEQVGGDLEQFKKDFTSPEVELSFMEDIQATRDYGVRGFPTLIFIAPDGKGFSISGTSGYSNYGIALEKTLGKRPEKNAITLDEMGVIKKFGYTSTREVAFLLDKSEKDCFNTLTRLAGEGKIIAEKQKYGHFWRSL